MLQNRIIDYGALAKACDFYSHRCYDQIEVPWIVEGEISRMTSPDGTDGVAFILHNGKHLVCSAEQGFLKMYMDGELETNQKYFSVSPCFRDELDETHSKWFMKLELFAVCSKNAMAAILVDGFIKGARTLYKELGVTTDITRTEIGFDLMAGTLELGSYGFRSIGDDYLAYGTGLALPRLSLAQELACQDII